MASLAATLLEPVVEKQAPLIDMDWTIFVQFAIFLLVALILSVFVFKPYFKVQAERTRRIDGAKADAKAMQVKAEGITSDYEEQLIKAKQRAAEERLKLRAEGQAHERDVVGKAREVGQKALDEARRKAEADRQAARAKLAADAQSIGRTIAGRVLGREVA